MLEFPDVPTRWPIRMKSSIVRLPAQRRGPAYHRFASGPGCRPLETTLSTGGRLRPEKLCNKSGLLKTLVLTAGCYGTPTIFIPQRDFRVDITGRSNRWGAKLWGQVSDYT